MSPSLRLSTAQLRCLGAPAVLVLLGLFAWHNTLENGFVYDDEANIVQNEAIRSLTPLWKFFHPSSSSTDAKMNAGIWRPLTRLVWALDYRIGGLDPRPYHATNLLLHLLNALLVFRLVGLFVARRRDGQDDCGVSTAGHRGPALSPGSGSLVPFASALVFLLHPVQVEAVAWVNGLSNLLFAFFCLSAFILYIHYRRFRQGREGVPSENAPGGRSLALSWPRYGASLGLYALGLLSKETAVVLPVLLLSYSWLFERGSNARRFRVPWLALAPYVGLTLGFLALRYAVLGNATLTGNWAGGTIPLALTMLKAFAIYVRLTVFPHPLSLEYLFAVKTAVDVEVLWGAALLGGLCFAVFHLRGRNPRLSLAGLLFFVPLLPASNIFPIETVLNERFLYLSLIGWGLLVGEALAWATPSRAPAPARIIAVCIFAGVCAAYVLGTIARNETWKDTYSLASANLKTCPQSSRLHYAMGQALAERGEWMEAVREYRMVLAIELYGDKTAGALAGSIPSTPRSWPERWNTARASR